MDTFIDANIIRRDLKLNDKNFEILVDYLARTNSRLILPSIVVEEIKGLYKRELQKRFEEYTKSLKKLKSTLLFWEVPDVPMPDIEGDSNRYINFLHQKLGTKATNIIPYKNEYLPELVKRAIERKKPLDDDGQQFRDGLLWLTLLDYAEKTNEKLVAFISDNQTDFAQKGESTLSLELIEEAKLRGVTIKYFQTLNDFAKEHASTIDFITEEWVKENIDFAIAEKLFAEILGDKQESAILGDLGLDKNERSTGDIYRSDCIESDLWDFFVYEKSDGTILLNIEIRFETYYEVEIERTTERDNARYDYVSRINHRTGEQEREMIYFPDFTTEREVGYKSINAPFLGKFVISIKDRAIDEYELTDWEWA